MKPIELYGKSIQFLSKAMDLRAQKHKLIVSNLANIDTPDYKAFEMHVERELKKTIPQKKNRLPMAVTQPGHLVHKEQETERINVTRRESSRFSLRGDGNTVNLDESMANLSKNNIMYNAAAQLISKKFQKLRTVIQGGDK